MKEVRKTLMGELSVREYVSPKVKLINFRHEGVICSSVGAGHEGFGDGGEYDL
jgi:hypothetical protein